MDSRGPALRLTHNAEENILQGTVGLASDLIARHTGTVPFLGACL